MNRRVLKAAFLKSVPVMGGYLILGIGFGVMLRDAGYGVAWAAAMSALIYAGSMQYVGVGLIAGGAGVFNVLITTLAVNARHLFYGVSMLDLYRDAGKKKPYLIFALTDETYTLLCDGSFPAGEDPRTYRFLVSLFDHSYWIAGSVAGSLLGEALPFDTAGIEFSMTALFLASFVSQWKKTGNHIPALAGVGCSVLCLLIFGADGFLIPAMLLITAALLLLRKKQPAKEATGDEA